jgi:hypothetical protein
MTTAIRWAGVIAAVGNTFLSQELVRIVFDLMDHVSGGERLAGGSMHLSGAAWPATWIYWASHIWLFAAVRQSCKSVEFRTGGWADAFLAVLVFLEIILIHFVVMMLRGSCHIEPALLW